MRRLAILVYRALLWVFYPARFRHAYASDMADAFEARLDPACRDGWPSALLFCVANYADIVRYGLAEWVSPTTARSRATGIVSHRSSWLLHTDGDVRVAWRGMIARPGFAAAVILTLALAVGANAALFGAIDAVLLTPLPLSDPDRIVVLGEHSPSVDTEFVSPVTFEDWRIHNDVFSDLAALRFWQNVNLEDGFGEPEPVDHVTASANFFSVLGVRPALGRTYIEEQRKEGGSEAVISHELWQRRYGGSPGVLGRTIQISGTARTIVGVLPPRSLNLDLGWGDVWTCVYFYDVQARRASSYRDRYFIVLGRLEGGLSLEEARQRMTLLQRQLWTEPGSVAEGYDVRLTPIADALTGRVRFGLWMALGAVGLVLLVGCANVANLMLVRASSRRRETAVRLALGATRMHLVRLFLTESLVLAGCGGLAGVAVAHGFLTLFRHLRPEFPRIAEAGITPGVLAFTALVTLTCAAVFSVTPIVVLRRGGVRDSLSDGGRGGSSSARTETLRRLLVASQIAFACLLLVCGGLLMRSLHNLLQVDVGFDPKGAVVFDLSLPRSRYADEAAYTRFYRELTRELSSTPGVASAGGLLYFPYKPKLWQSGLWIEDAPSIEGQEPIVYFNQITADYFAAMGIRLLEGRTPTAEEMWERRQVVVINQALARQFFPNRSPLGRRIRNARSGPWFQIIGVVDDVRQAHLEAKGAPEFYLTFSSMPMPFLTLVVRADRSVADIAEPVRQTLRRLDAGLAIAEFASLDDYVKARTSDRRAAVWLLGGFALLTLGLGGIGIYGVVSYAVAERRREIAVRLALGAAPGGVQIMVLRDGIRVALAGALVGLLGAWLTGRYVQTLLFGVESFDGLTYGVVAFTLLAVAGVASWLPARRASRVQALAALRSE